MELPHHERIIIPLKRNRSVPFRGPNVVIYAQHPVPIPPEIQLQNPSPNHTYKAGCTIIEHYHQKYVLSVRRELIQCREINMFYCIEDDTGKLIYRNKLHILFQSIEIGIVVLGTVGFKTLQLENSELVSKNGDIVNLSDQTLPSSIIPMKFIVPARSGIYFTRNINIKSTATEIIYTNTVTSVKYLKSIIDNKTYLPSNYLYIFESLAPHDLVLHDCGDAIWDGSVDQTGTDTNSLIGLIIRTNGKILSVLPMKHIQKILTIFISGTVNSFVLIGTEYESLPFTYDIIDRNIIISSVDHPKLKPSDQIVSIDNKEISVKKKKFMVYDEDYGKELPLDVYARQNFTHGIPINIVVKKFGLDVILEYEFVLKPFNPTKIFPLTDQPYFYPQYLIPYTNLNGLIIVRLTHELIDMMVYHKIRSDSYFMNDIMTGKCAGYHNTFIIIECCTPKIKKKLLKLNCDGQQMIILSMNGSEIHSLNDINRLKKKSNKLIVTYIRNQSCEIIC